MEIVDKLLDLVKTLLDKYLFQSLVATAGMIITIALLPKDFFAQNKVSDNELKVLIWILYFLIVCLIQFIYKKTKKWYLSKKNKKILDEKEKISRELEEIETIENLRKIIVNLNPCDKEMLLKAIEEEQKIFSLEDRTYKGTLLNSEFVDILKKYTKREEVNIPNDATKAILFCNSEEHYTDIKIRDDFLYFVKKVYVIYGRQCFESE